MDLNWLFMLLLLIVIFAYAIDAFVSNMQAEFDENHGDYE
jgi:hypothetical protein